jgi:hypothetical protein
MPKINGQNENVDTTALEMQPFNRYDSDKTTTAKGSPTIGVSDRSSFSHVCFRGTQLIMIIKLYMDTYPRMTAWIAACMIGMLFLTFVLSFRQPVKRNKLYHDYSKIDRDYNFKASQIDHWCLYGGDDACSCDDFTEPLNRYAKKDWIETHDHNVELIDPKQQYDVVFYGDEVTEGWNGRWLGRSMIPPSHATQIRQFFNETFTKSGGGEFDGVALGIMGDVVRRYVTNVV